MRNLDINKFAPKVFYALSIVLVIIMSLAKNFVPLVSALLIISWFFESTFNQKWLNLKKNKSILFFVSLYFLYLIGLLYSDNIQYGLMDIVLKLPFVIFPLIYFSAETAKKTNFFRDIIIAFVFAGFIGTLISLSHSAFLYSSSHDIFDFYYNTLAYFIHPSYYAMQLNFSIIALLWLVLKKNSVINKKQPLVYFLIFYFSVFVVFLNSKVGIMFLALICFYVVYLFIKLKRYLSGSVLILIVALSVFYIVRNFPGITNRIVSATEIVSNYSDIANSTNEGTAERILIWKTSLEIISENWVVGVGTGDVKDVLLAKYKTNGISGAFKKKLNAHNQFLQTFISLGITGFLLLMLMFAYAVFISIKTGNIVYFFFIVLLMLNLLVESMFETQSGIVFYSFFNALLYIESTRRKDVSL